MSLLALNELNLIWRAGEVPIFFYHMFFFQINAASRMRRLFEIFVEDKLEYYKRFFALRIPINDDIIA